MHNVNGALRLSFQQVTTAFVRDISGNALIHPGFASDSTLETLVRWFSYCTQQRVNYLPVENLNSA